MEDRVDPAAGVRPDLDSRHVVVLAGGDGRRLASVAEGRYGYPRPKQYCSFGPDGTLLEQTLRRALRFARDPTRIVVTTARGHRREADECLAGWPGIVRVEQPRNLDTTPGVVLPLIDVLVRDPLATVLVLPCDHWISDDERFADTLADASAALARDPARILLAGAELDEAEPDLGWIVPGADEGPWRSVDRFVEKPSAAEAAALHRAGAYANTFVLLARGVALAEVVRTAAPAWWNALVNHFFRTDALDRVYERMPPSSLSRDVLARVPKALGVVPLPGIGWSDIGTPERLARVRSAPRPVGPTAADVAA